MEEAGPFSNPVRGTLKPALDAGFKVFKRARTQIRTELKKKFKEKMAENLPYKTARLSNSDPKDWFVFYYYRDPESKKFERFKEREGLNNFRYLKQLSSSYNKSLEECRLIVAEEMIKVIDEELKKGFNPFKQGRLVNSLENETLSGIIHAVVEKLCAAATQNSKETYRLMHSRFKKFLTEKKYSELPTGVFSTDHAEEFQDYLKNSMKLAKKTVNTTISHLGKFWDSISKDIRPKENPFRLIKPLTDKHYRGLKSSEEDEDIFEPLTTKELDLLLKELNKTEQFDFILFLGFIYYAWMRPVEITRLKIHNIDFQHSIINTNKRDTKNKKGGMIQIVPQLMELLKKRKIDKVKNQDLYLFSTGFKPGVKQLDSSRGVGKYIWNPVTEKLKINKKMYALKHTGNIEYLLQNKGNINLKWQQTQNRHSSATMTENYNRKLGAFFLDLEGVKFRNF
jgi:integrase